jgi:hypothetical protein
MNRHSVECINLQGLNANHQYTYTQKAGKPPSPTTNSKIRYQTICYMEIHCRVLYINYIILYCFTTTISVPWTVDIVLIRPNKSIKEFQYDSPNHNIVNMDYFSFVFVCQLRIFIRVKMLKCMINPTCLSFLCIPVLFTKNVVICLVSWAEKINERIK